MTSTLERRIELLGRQCASLRAVVFLLLLIVLPAIGFLGYHAWNTRAPTVLRAQRIEIINSDGIPALVLAATPEGGQVRTLLPSGLPSAVLGASVQNGDGALTLFTHLGSPLAQLGTFSDDARGLLTYTQNADIGAIVGVDAFGFSMLRLQYDNADRLRLLGNAVGGELWSWNARGSAVFQLGASSLGNGQLLASNEVGIPIFKLGASVGGAGFLQTYNNQGTELVRLGATTNGIGLVLTSDTSGQPAVQLTGTSDGRGAISVHPTRLGDAALTFVADANE